VGIHFLKVNTVSFDAIQNGSKRHQVHEIDEHEFQFGDVVYLREWVGYYTQREMVFKIGHVSHLPDSQCVFSLLDLDPEALGSAE
jgi:hypothetical protein